jgi:hypothetical protein
MHKPVPVTYVLEACFTLHINYRHFYPISTCTISTVEHSGIDREMREAQSTDFDPLKLPARRARPNWKSSGTFGDAGGLWIGKR